MSKLIPKEFYLNTDVCVIARQLIGKMITTVSQDNVKIQAIITETEAYAGVDDKASHAYNNKRTNRTEVMYSEGGIAYVYLCYGMHYLFNVVTNFKENPHAVLIRSIFPLCFDKSISLTQSIKLGKGPGRTTKILGINMSHNGKSLQSKQLQISETKIIIPDKAIQISARIGINFADEDAQLPYRFYIDENLNPEIFQIFKSIQK